LIHAMMLMNFKNILPSERSKEPVVESERVEKRLA